MTKRRAFLRQLGGIGALAAPAVAQPAPPALDLRGLIPPGLAGNDRLMQALQLRVSTAMQDTMAGPVANLSNGDADLYPDHAGTFTKALPHDVYGRVNPAAFASFQNALQSGEFSDFEKIVMGGTRTLNGPQGGLAFDLSMKDNSQFGPPQVPPAPKLASDQTATELVEHYWASLLRDVPFTEYSSNALAALAAAELGSQASYTGPRNPSGAVTTDLLFRGGFPGETAGPYLSQFLLQPTFLGSQPITQQQWTYVPGIDYATDFSSWLQVQNGIDTGLRNQMDPVYRYRRNGRDLSSLTHMDVLFQEYLVACMVLAASINPAAPGSFAFGGAPLNPGNPYNSSLTQNGFGTFGGPDIGAAIEEVAIKALNAVWYQKWFVHLRPRPEAIGGLVHLIMTGQQDVTDARLSSVVFNSQALAQSYKKFGTYLLAQAFPEGSPTHPAYPTGHGTVAGACITVLKFYYDGSFVIPNPVVASADGSALLPYTGADAGELTVNGELNKLGHNVSFGHGIHAGIHWRSDTDTSLLLGEAVALSYLHDKARTYNEPFTVNITKFDGTTATITNQGNS
jgi:hypothetical protein